MDKTGLIPLSSIKEAWIDAHNISFNHKFEQFDGNKVYYIRAIEALINLLVENKIYFHCVFDSDIESQLQNYDKYTRGKGTPTDYFRKFNEWKTNPSRNVGEIVIIQSSQGNNSKADNHIFSQVFNKLLENPNSIDQIIVLTGTERYRNLLGFRDKHTFYEYDKTLKTHIKKEIDSFYYKHLIDNGKSSDDAIGLLSRVKSHVAPCSITTSNIGPNNFEHLLNIELSGISVPIRRNYPNDNPCSLNVPILEQYPKNLLGEIVGKQGTQVKVDDKFVSKEIKTNQTITPNDSNRKTKIIVYHLDNYNKEHILTDKNIYKVGRALDCDIVINLGFISRYHFEIIIDNDSNSGYSIRNLSKTSTLLNGVRLGNDSYHLQKSCKIELSKNEQLVGATLFIKIMEYHE